MEIKRRITAAAKRLTPEIEASNTGTQLNELTTRFEELLDYAEEKDLRRQEAVKTGMSFSQRAAKKRAAIEQKGKDIQAADEAEILADQVQQEAQPDVVDPDPAEPEVVGASAR